MKPSSFCTIATIQCKQELAGFLFSLSIHHPRAIVYIMADTETKKFIQNGYIPNLKIIWDVSLDTYSRYNRAQMEKIGIWSEFQMSKANIIETALEYEKDTLFLDSDIIILDEINDIQEKELGVSPGFVKHDIVQKYGYYNGGMLWTNQKSLPEKWRQYTKLSRYYDQASIEDLCKDYSHFMFKDNYNLQTWRFICGEESTETIMSYIKIHNHKIIYKTRPLKFIHTHFNLPHFKYINDYFIKLLKLAKYDRELLCVKYVIHSKWHFELSKKSSPWNELVLLMSKKNDIEYELSDCDTTRIGEYVFDTEVPKKPVLLESLIKWLPYKDRTHLCIEGKTQKETYINMSKSRYGVGNMSELMAFGTIPILKKCIHPYYVTEPNLSEEAWTDLSRKAQLWYTQNRHSSNIWYTIVDQFFQ